MISIAAPTLMYVSGINKFAPVSSNTIFASADKTCDEYQYLVFEFWERIKLITIGDNNDKKTVTQLHSYTVTLLALTLLFVGCTNNEEPSGQPTTPSYTPDIEILVGTGHGAFFTKGGYEIVPTIHHILASQNYLIEKWSKALGDLKPEIIYQDDRVIQNYNIIVALLARAQIEGLLYSSNQQLNNGLYGFYLAEILKDSAASRIGELNSTNSREDYMDECRANGVPVPDRVLGRDWKNHGELKTEFIIVGSIAELWSWESEVLDGLCVALPRWKSGQATAFGVICLGRDTSKVCYFDNPTQKTTAPNYDPFYADRNAAGSAGYPIQKFINGFDLEEHSGGECTDCHAGENPFIVHPNDPAFMSLTSTREIRSKAWPDPIVHPDWYQNPYPIQNGALPNGKCNGCHIQGNDKAGPFPAISRATELYCSRILERALNGQKRLGELGFPAGTPDLMPTMTPQYDPQGEYLKGLCKEEPDKGGLDLGLPVENPPGDDRGFLSPPIVASPLYECAESVLVRGARVGSEIELSLNGVVIGTQLVVNVDGAAFSINPLSKDDRLTATQRFGNFSSLESPRVIVRSHTEDYPNGLPKPEISREIHECSRSVAITHIAGAALRLSKTNGPTWNGGGSRRNTSFRIGTTIKIKDRFTVAQGFCGDFSPPSDPREAKAEPSPMPKVQIPQTIEGQNIFKFKKLAGGSSLNIDATAGSDAHGSWAFYSKFWNHESRLGTRFGASHSLEATQTLCTTSEVTVAPKSLNCNLLPEARIIPPVAGENYISIMNPVAGAWIQVYDGQDREIGDGSALTILLSRELLAGEAITIVRSLNEDCRGKNGRQFIVKQGNGMPIKGE